MRTNRIACLALTLTSLLSACELNRTAAAPPPVPRPNLQHTDSIVVVGRTLLVTSARFSAPAPQDFFTDTARQRELDVAATRSGSRNAWALYNPVTHDKLTAYLFAGDTVRGPEFLRSFTRSNKNALQRGWTVDEDTVDWHDAVREARLRAHGDAGTFSMRCKSSVEADPKPFVACFVASGATAATTLSKTVAGFKLGQYMGPSKVAAAPGLAQQGSARAPEGVPDLPPMPTFANGKIVSTFAGFTAPVQPTVIIDTNLTRMKNQPTFGRASAWALRDTAASDTINFVAYLAGDYAPNDTVWRHRAVSAIQGVFMRNPGSILLDSSVVWRDTATYSYWIRDAHNVYHGMLCKGSAVGRVRFAAVCMSATTKRADGFDVLLAGFRLSETGEVAKTR